MKLNFVQTLYVFCSMMIDTVQGAESGKKWDSKTNSFPHTMLSTLHLRNVSFNFHKKHVRELELFLSFYRLKNWGSVWLVLNTTAIEGIQRSPSMCQGLSPHLTLLIPWSQPWPFPPTNPSAELFRTTAVPSEVQDSRTVWFSALICKPFLKNSPQASSPLMCWCDRWISSIFPYLPDPKDNMQETYIFGAFIPVSAALPWILSWLSLKLSELKRF